MTDHLAKAALLHKALSVIAGNCDGALERDGVGFDGTDTKFGKRAAAMPASVWTEEIIADVSSILPKYHRQLAAAGVDISSLPLDGAHNTNVRMVARQQARHAEWQAKQNVKQVTVNVHGTVLSVTNCFAIKDELKASGARWNLDRKSWDLPATPTGWQAVERALGDRTAVYGPGVQDLIGKLPANEPEAPVAQVTLSRESRGRQYVNLVTPYNEKLVADIRNLTGRKYLGGGINEAVLDAKLAQVAIKHGLVLAPDVQDRLGAVMVEAAQEVDLAALRTVASRATNANVPVALADKLYPFQRAGVAYALSTPRVLIADEMGLGKSRQALSVLETKIAYPAIIVCPSSLKSNWLHEISMVLPNRSVFVASGRTAEKSAADITIVNYDILTSWVPILAGARAAIFDESHYLKTPSAGRTKAAQTLVDSLSDDASVLCLTGTPILNRPVELVEQLKLLGHLHGREASNFLFSYCGPHNNGYGWTFTGATHLDRLNEWLRETCMVRRLKAEVLTELPPKVRAVQPVTLSPRAAALYRQLEREGFEEASQSNAATLVYLTKLRSAIGQAKTVQAVEWVQAFLESGKSLVVFADHISVQRKLVDDLKAVHILGGERQSDIEEAKRLFQAGAAKVIVCSLKAAREGHTLTAASDVLFVEMGWTPGEHSQAEDRCHRIGQADSVTAWYLVAEATVDEDTYEIIERKRGVVDATSNGIAGGTESPSNSVVNEVMQRLTGRYAVMKGSA